MHRILERKRLKKGRNIILHSRFSRKMSAEEIRVKIINASPRQLMKK